MTIPVPLWLEVLGWESIFFMGWLVGKSVDYAIENNRCNRLSKPVLLGWVTVAETGYRQAETSRTTSHQSFRKSQ